MDLADARTAGEAAAALLEAAAEVEPETTADLVAMAPGIGEMAGLEFRLKGAASLERKIADLVTLYAGTATPADIAVGISDVLRYTVIIPEETYVAGFEAMIGRLEDAGYRVVAVKNSWGNPSGYRGINTVIESPTGQRFELQFHTADSFQAKTETHVLYEEQRRADTTPARRDELQREMDRRFDQVPVPPDAPDVRAVGSAS